MWRTLLMLGALCLALTGAAQAQPGGGRGPTTKPATGQQPVGKPPGGGHGGGKPSGPTTKPAWGQRPVGKPPGGGGKPGGGKPPPGGHWKPGRPGHGRPPHGGRPPGHRPPNQWHRPRPNQWYWHGRWIGRIRGPAFAYPPGYAYLRWSAGLLLPAIFISQNFYYGGYASLGLPPPGPGYRWIRFGPDLVLVNLATGRIVDVAYGVFL